MASAEVGALRARLDLDAGGFVEALASSSAKLSQFQRQFSAMGSTLTGAARNIAGALVAAFSIHAIKQALEYADAMGKAAQAAGMTTAEFSALAHAASLSDVGIEELSAAISRFNRNIVETASGASGAGFALKAMGIEIRGVDGGVRNVSELLADVADKFHNYKDSAEKSALAVELFGRSGAQLIPLLNQGRDGLEALKTEAQRLGIVVDTETAKKAEEFNDALKKMGNASRATLVDLGALVAGPLTAFADKILSLQAYLRGRNVITEILGDNRSAMEYRAQLEALNSQLERMVKQRAAEGNTPWVRPERLAQLDALIARQEKLINQQKARAGLAAEKPWDAATAVQEGANTAAVDVKKLETLAEIEYEAAVRKSRDAIEENQKQVELYGQALADLATPMDAYRQKLLDIAQAARAGAVDQDKLAVAGSQAWFKMQAAYASGASAITGALTELFNKNKAIAYANALVSTYEAVAKAQATAAPPLSYALMAAALIRGMAQVRAIQATSPGSGGGAAAAGGAVSSGGGAVSDGGSPAAPAVVQRNLTVEGFEPNHWYKGDQMIAFLATVNDYVKDGHVLIATKMQPQ